MEKRLTSDSFSAKKCHGEKSFVCDTPRPEQSVDGVDAATMTIHNECGLSEYTFPARCWKKKVINQE